MSKKEATSYVKEEVVVVVVVVVVEGRLSMIEGDCVRKCQGNKGGEERKITRESGGP